MRPNPHYPSADRATNENLKTKFPFLQDNSPHTYVGPEESWADMLPIGWRALFLEYCEQIVNLFKIKKVSLDNFHFGQVKEKFGAARIYFDIDVENESLHEEITVLTDNLELKTGKTCSICGREATHRSTGWVLPYCINCAIEENNAANSRHNTNVTLEQGYKPL